MVCPRCSQRGHFFYTPLTIFFLPPFFNISGFPIFSTYFHKIRFNGLPPLFSAGTFFCDSKLTFSKCPSAAPCPVFTNFELNFHRIRFNGLPPLFPTGTIFLYPFRFAVQAFPFIIALKPFICRYFFRLFSTAMNTLSMKKCSSSNFIIITRFLTIPDCR